MSNRLAAALLAAGCLLAGCSGSSSDGIGPTDPTSGNGDPGVAAGVGEFVPLFRPTRRPALPDRPVFQRLDRRHAESARDAVSALTPHFATLNALDGFSTLPISTLRFSGAIDAATLERT